MNKTGRVAGVLLLAAACAAGGCATPGPLRVVPVKAGGKQVLPLTFSTAVFRVDRGGTLHFCFRQHTPAPGGGVIRQVLLVRVFWKPIPGQTPIARTAINATYRYIVMTPNGAGMYEGAGFVWLHNNRMARTMHATVLAGDLRLTQATAYFRDPLGRSQVKGNFVAQRSGAQTLALALQAQRQFFRTTYEHRAAPQ